MRYRIEWQAAGTEERRLLGDDGNDFGSKTRALGEAQEAALLGGAYAGATYYLVEIETGRVAESWIIDGGGWLSPPSVKVISSAVRVIETEGVEVDGAEASGLSVYARDVVSAYPREALAEPLGSAHVERVVDPVTGKAVDKLRTCSAYGQFAGGRFAAIPETVRIVRDEVSGYPGVFVAGRVEKR
jgi:hypothetical protein